MTGEEVTDDSEPDEASTGRSSSFDAAVPSGYVAPPSSGGWLSGFLPSIDADADSAAVDSATTPPAAAGASGNPKCLSFPYRVLCAETHLVPEITPYRKHPPPRRNPPPQMLTLDVLVSITCCLHTVPFFTRLTLLRPRYYFLCSLYMKPLSVILRPPFAVSKSSIFSNM